MKLIFTLFKVLRQVKNKTISRLKNIFERYGSFKNQWNKLTQFIENLIFTIPLDRL
ncbi:hypothetical protein LEP1GSC170_4336 [Leptospira interrogans serovar Bataviae str. HAI135]|nr:hypothetical protein LEP1GSC072_0502 [Leptospira noguchii str. Bonito]EMO28128.1 hypothetical protein LEP1GSC170_4336 [Leptospira interrogans serovar Bataviae str. HAI135]